MIKLSINKKRPAQCVLALLLWATASMGLAQDCNNAVIPSAPDSRYQDNGDSTVTDIHTGLMWQQCSAGYNDIACIGGSISNHNWDQALQYPQTLNASGGFAGYTDWRLPNLNELASLLETACIQPAINALYFPRTSDSGYWSSSANAANDTDAWYIAFGLGFSDYMARNTGYHLRLVRSAY